MAALRCILQPCNPCHRQHIKKHVTRTSIRPHGCHQLCSITAAGTAPLHRRPDPKPSPGGKQDSSHHWQTAASHYIHLSQAAILGLLLAAGRRSHSTLSALQHKRHVCRTAATRATAALSGENNKEERKPHHAINCTSGQAAQHFHQSASAGGTAWLANSSRGRNAAASLPPHPFLADTHTDTCTCWHTRVARSGLLLLLLRCPHTTPRKPRAAPAQLPQLLWQHTSQHRPTAGSSSSRTRSPGPCPLQSQPSQKCPCWQSPPLSRCRRSPASLLCC